MPEKNLPPTAEKVYSNRLFIAYLQKMDEAVGKAETDKILESIKLDRHKLMDQAGFVTTRENDDLVEAAIKVTGEQDLPYITGRNLPNSVGPLTAFILGGTSPSFFVKAMGGIEERLALKTINKSTHLGPNRIRVDITFRDGFREKQYVCRNRLGCYESMPLFFGLPYAEVEHSECAFKGADHCVYIINFPESKIGVFNRIFQACTVAAMVLGVAWLFEPGNAWILTASLGIAGGGFLSFAHYRHMAAKKALDWSLLTNEGLAKQNRMLETNNMQINSLQDLTTILNNNVRVQDICDKMVGMLVRDFQYGSSQIWLLDEKKEYLSCHSALGYSRDLQAFIRNTRFKIGENWDNPYGLLVQTLEQKKTLLINDPEEVYARVSERTRDFLRALNISSFIITPLVHAGKPLGILAAEYHKGEKLGNQDKLLFQSVSNSVASALVKANLFEDMEAKVQQRTRELEAATQQLMAAKEMAIQSEKLSSLGQMAAGVAHEINNPLNFLVNIMPDVRRDLDGLERIRQLAAKAGVGEGIAREIKQVEDQYDLEAHLSEKDFVFEKIQKALDKSTRIANSLKVFSRSSSKEKVARESFADMIKSVTDLMPQKVLGDTRIITDIPPDLDWNVNKNEMEQAFLALINNAVDAMGQKGRLEISAVSSPGEIILSFKDEGPGIPEAYLKKIFDPFYTTKPPGKGTGLGLTIAAEIVKKYGGALGVESVPGAGTTFRVRFRKAGFAG